jgi:hypothetical protein
MSMGSKVTLSNKAYNFIKYLITIFLPAVGAFYFALAQIWDFPRLPGVNGTINAAIAFLGLLIGYSSKQYKKSGESDPTSGDLVVAEDPETGEKGLGLAINRDAFENLGDATKVTLNVVQTKAPTAAVTPVPPVE